MLDLWTQFPHRFSKFGWNACRCHGRRQGSPKTGTGCKGGLAYRDSIRERIEGKRECTRWQSQVWAGLTEDDV